MRISKTALIVIAFAGLGGILYGFDIGVVSGALVFMKKGMALSSVQASLIVAAVLGGGSLAILFSGPMADHIGRRLSINVSAIIFIVGVIVLTIANGFTVVMIGRLIQGIGIGIITIVVPLYVTETAPASVRGRGIALFQLCLTFGVLIGYLVNVAFKETADWRAMFSVVLIPAIIFLLGGVFLLPRSPRWLYLHGLKEESEKTLSRVLGTGVDVTKSINGIKMAIAREKENTGLSWSLLLKKGYRLPFTVAVVIGVLNQLTGINVLNQFNATILNASGLHLAVLASTVVGGAQFIFTIIGLLLVDRIGRRPLLIIGTAGVAASLIFIGLIHFLAPTTSMFTGYATLAGFIVFVSFFATGPGIVVWLAVSEILPLVVRAKGMAIALFANSLASAVLAATFMTAIDGIGYGGTFLMLACFAVLYVLTAVFLLPETKGRTLEDIEEKMLHADGSLHS